MSIPSIRGFNDILPGDSELWRSIEDQAIRLLTVYGFSEIRIPLLEKSELFIRGVGSSTDIVEKEMYVFNDRRGMSLTLRPEGTASVVRAYIQHKLYNSPLSKLYYMGPMFRYERPQKGRYRQFYQIGAEVLSESSPKLDAEMISMLDVFFRKIGIDVVEIQLNSLGCPVCRPRYKDRLKEFMGSNIDCLCADCLRRLSVNPLRTLDCKDERCVQIAAEAPHMTDYLCTVCEDHFGEVKGSLSELSVDFTLNPYLVRGLDYYSRTAFEVKAPALGAQNTVAAGGRYDFLVNELGGPDTPCFGFAIGMERLSLILKERAAKQTPLFFIALFGEERTRARGMSVIKELREHGMRTEWDYSCKGIKSQMKRADRLGADVVLIFGDNELERGVVGLKDMRKGVQVDIPLDSVVKVVTGTFSSGTGTAC